MPKCAHSVHFRSVFMQQVKFWRKSTRIDQYRLLWKLQRTTDLMYTLMTSHIFIQRSIALEYCTYHRNFHVFIVKLTRLGEAYCFSRQLLNKLLAAIKHLLQSPTAWNAICVTDTETPTRTFGTSKTSVPRNKAPNQFSHRRIQAKQDLNWVTAGIGK